MKKWSWSLNHMQSEFGGKVETAMGRLTLLS